MPGPVVARQCNHSLPALGCSVPEIKTQLLTPVMITAGRHREREQRQGFGIEPVHMTCTGCISGLVAEYIVAIDVTRVRFPADACITGRWPVASAE